MMNHSKSAYQKSLHADIREREEKEENERNKQRKQENNQRDTRARYRREKCRALWATIPDAEKQTYTPKELDYAFWGRFGIGSNDQPPYAVEFWDKIGYNQFDFNNQPQVAQVVEEYAPAADIPQVEEEYTPQVTQVAGGYFSSVNPWSSSAKAKKKEKNDAMYRQIDKELKQQETVPQLEQAIKDRVELTEEDKQDFRKRGVDIDPYGNVIRIEPISGGRSKTRSKTRRKTRK